MPNKFCQVSKIMVFRGKMLKHAFYHFCSAEIFYSFHVQSTVKCSWPVAVYFCVDIFVLGLACQGKNKCFLSSLIVRKILGGMLTAFTLIWLNFVARSCLQVRVLLIFCPSFALFFISMLFVVYFHACVILAKQVSVLIHAALS